MALPQVRVSVNPGALTVEQVVSKMQRSQLQLIDMLTDEAAFAGAPAKAITPLKGLRELMNRQPPHFFKCVR